MDRNSPKVERRLSFDPKRCTTCNGTGKDGRDNPCKACNGKGEIQPQQ
jgi:DnaJ-class molecular chaperone